ncbi:hypothetical protein ABEW32_08955 [Paenibacillus jamilae]|uniref:hypothetical protein n=1 Tax=Paenibacillus jamilae TaxID=114136 RepID=UPI003D2A9FDC
MRAVPKVNPNGLYLEDQLVDDAFMGVVPFYASLETMNQTMKEKKLAGYIVGIPVPTGLYQPHFDIQSWLTHEAEYDEKLLEAQKMYEQLSKESQAAFQKLHDEWQNMPENERGDEPVYLAQTFTAPERRDPTTFWSEGLSGAAIKELTQKSIQQLSETDLLKQRIADLELTLTQLMLGNTGN